NHPAFEAGTVAPLAGNYSPFVLHISREDGTQRISNIDTTLPLGLTGKLKGVPYCPEAQIKAAEGSGGADQQHHPTCQAASEIGVANVAAGPASDPYQVQGKAYLAGPYK